MTRTIDPLQHHRQRRTGRQVTFRRCPANAAMDRYANGDDGAFGDLYDLLAPRLYGYLLRQTRNTARAEDLVQQTFLQMHCARGRFIVGADVVPWAFAIARRLMIDGMRRGKREVLSSQDDESLGAEPVASGLAADDAVHAKQIAARIQHELARLPEIAEGRLRARQARWLVDGRSSRSAGDFGLCSQAARAPNLRGAAAVLGDLVGSGL